VDAQVVSLVLALLAAGCLTGIVAGLFGLGGGAIMVPVLKYTFEALGYSEAVTMHMAVATSTSVVIIAALRSTQGHHKKGVVDWPLIWSKNLFKSWGVWIGLGALLAAAFLAPNLSGRQLTILFATVIVPVSLQFIFGRPGWKLAEDIPAGLAPPIGGLGLGGLCALMGVGFGSIGVTLQIIFGRRIHQAIGTAAALGFFIGAPATAGYIISGLGVEGRPPFSWGYVNLLGFALMAAATFIFVPYGVRLAHKLSQDKLRMVFGLCLLAIAVNMLRKTLF